MKKISMNVICFLAGIFSIQSQVLFGTSYFGGNSEAGTIYRLTPSSNIFTVVKSFERNPYFPLDYIQAKNGKLYGVTLYGGKHNLGVIFSFDPSTSTYTKLKDFNNTDGAKSTKINLLCPVHL